MFTLWFIVAALIMAAGLYVVGALDWDGDEKISLFWTIFICALGWPIAFGVLIVAGPFYGFFWLGDRARRKREAAAKNQSPE